MAKWVLYERNDGNLGFLYKAEGQESQDLGIMQPSTPEDMIMDWVMNNGAQAGDLVLFSSGRVAQIMDEIGEA